MAYALVVGDNFQPQDAAFERETGVFPTAGEAIAAAQRAIERSLAECFKPGMSAEELLDVFSGFGEITVIFKDKGDARAEFDPWKHARKRAGELAQAERN